eukprot:COSAG04_NODE_5499_length_1595_cov_3.180481_1_plen_60_part_10
MLSLPSPVLEHVPMLHSGVRFQLLGAAGDIACTRPPPMAAAAVESDAARATRLLCSPASA